MTTTRPYRASTLAAISIVASTLGTVPSERVWIVVMVVSLPRVNVLSVFGAHNRVERYSAPPSRSSDRSGVPKGIGAQRRPTKILATAGLELRNAEV
ncbi:exported hypothetical protein [uncultured Mycobacterium sp.]|uniref:Uncharacterized protein n=1 Tax=uncultured Mycobacterium sp. TaxID=171292 RepID=A0A1Y5PCP6_9MYCO|nr:exported hypothetical protein [uncultured Mycobacterium sp.]